jgi:hypothetical protein
VALLQAVPLAKLMAACLARPEMAVVETALEYFNALDYVLMADRDPLLRAPLYRDLLPSLMRHARYPEGFTSWEDHVDDDRDEDSFKRFRRVGFTLRMPQHERGIPAGQRQRHSTNVWVRVRRAVQLHAGHVPHAVMGHTRLDSGMSRRQSFSEMLLDIWWGSWCKLDVGLLCCREHSLTDALETSYNVLRVEYLRTVSQAFEDAAAWQDAEAALFALR